ncbi:hypothetical protein GRC12_17580 [Streptomyces griseorubiginosus]|nr:hypothetical protein [Streptomyces griseorubiginosus]
MRKATEGVEVARRRAPDADHLLLIGHTDRDAHIPVSPEATELLSGKPATGGGSRTPLT